MKAVFFDLGETLGRPVLSAPPVHLVGFEVFDFTVSVLTDLGLEAGLCLGVISHTGDDAGPVVDEILDRAGIRDFFEPALRIYSRDVGLRKDTPEIFLLAAGRAGAAPGECLFVGESPAERQVAAAAGFLVAAHPLDAREVIEGADRRG